MKEMEAIVDSEFSEVFVPLLMAMSSYCGVQAIAKPSGSGNKALSGQNLSAFQAAFQCFQVTFVYILKLINWQLLYMS